MNGAKPHDYQRYRTLLIVLPVLVLTALLGRLSATNTPRAVLLALAGMGGMGLVYIFFKRGRLSLRRVIIPLLLVAVLLPSVQLPGAMPAVRLELVIIIVAWALLLLDRAWSLKPVRLKWNPTNKWFFLFGACILASIAYAGVVEHYYPMGRDFWEVGKLAEYSLIFALVASLDIPPEDVRKYYSAVLVVFLCSAAAGFAQYYDLFNVNSWLSPYYAPSQIQGLLTEGRITGTTSNPNEFGALMTMGACLALTGTVWLEGRGVRLLSWVVVGVCSLAVVLTLSRSALLLLLVGATFILLFKYPKHFGLAKTTRMLIVVVPLLVVLGLALFQLAPDYFAIRVESALDLATDTSWQARTAKWANEFEVWRQSPILGWGPGKETMTTVVDNEWLLLLRRYGVVGVSVFVLWFSGVYRTLSTIAKGTEEKYAQAFCGGLQATLVVYAIFMIPAAVYHDLQLMPILVILLGLAYTQRRTSGMVEEG